MAVGHGGAVVIAWLADSTRGWEGIGEMYVVSVLDRAVHVHADVSIYTCHASSVVARAMTATKCYGYSRSHC